MIFGQMGTFNPNKAPKSSLRERIRRVLAGGRTIVGRGELQRELWPDGKWTLEDTADLNRAVNGMIQDGELIETKTDVPGAHEFPAVSEWHYRLAPPAAPQAPAPEPDPAPGYIDLTGFFPP